MKLLESSPRISEIECRLAKHTFLSRHSLPGCLDGSVFLSLLHNRTYPDRATHPHLYHWYILMRQFAIRTVRSWIEHRLYYTPDDALLPDSLFRPASNHDSTLPSSPPSTQTEQQARQSQLGSEVIEVQYTIMVLLKECSSSEAVKKLQACLPGLAVEAVGSGDSREVQVRCGESWRRQEVVNIIERNVEYTNLQVKRTRAPRPACLTQSYP